MNLSHQFLYHITSINLFHYFHIYFASLSILCFLLYIFIYHLLMLLTGHFQQAVPLDLLILGVIPIAERDVELVAGKTSVAESAVNSASVRSNENLTIIDKADRGVIHRLATIELRSQPHEVGSFFLVKLRVNHYHTRIHPDRVNLQSLHSNFANHFFTS